MLNKFYNYENLELWDEGKWKDKISTIFGLVLWLGSHEEIDRKPYGRPIGGLTGKDCEKLGSYTRKTNSVAIPEVVQHWRDEGLNYECRSQGGVTWIAMTPVKALADFGTKLKTLVVFHCEDLSDPYWAMKTLDRFDDYNKMAAEAQDMIIVYIVTNGPDKNRIYINILQEAFVLVPGDVRRVFLDIGLVYQAGHQLRDIPGFTYFDEKGSAVPDPDKAVVRFGAAGVPAIDISGRWENKCSLTRDQVSKENWSSADFDLARVVRSESGKKMAEGMALEYRYDRPDDPGLLKYWEDMGLRCEMHEKRFERWISAVPLCAFDEPGRKLPAICVMQEVNHANEHLAVTCFSYFLEYFKIAAQGECILINFVLEDNDGNDLLTDILAEALQKYPIDPSRVYIAGHSHNGHYSLEFALRHPDLIAAVATYGDPPGLLAPNMTDEKIEALSKIDLPLIALCGYSEPALFFPLSKAADTYRPGQGKGPAPVTFEEKAASWLRRLKASNCPAKSFEEIAATADSPENAIRKLGIPGDRSETLWLDGFEHYIVDVKNNLGQYHLRIVGEENMPHNTTPVQQVLSWSFMRRFARDRATGETIERY